MLVLELMCEAVGVVGIGVLLLVLLLVLWLLLLRIGVRMLLLLLRALRGGEVARLLLLIGGTRIGGVVATVFAWGAHSCGRYEGNGYSKGGNPEGGEVRGRCCQQERKGGEKREWEKEKKAEKRQK